MRAVVVTAGVPSFDDDSVLRRGVRFPHPKKVFSNTFTTPPPAAATVSSYHPTPIGDLPVIGLLLRHRLQPGPDLKTKDPDHHHTPSPHVAKPQKG